MITRFKFWLLVSAIAASFVGGALAQVELLSEAEISSLKRENELWRSVKVDADVATNVAALRAAGFTEGEIGRVMPRLISLWQTPMPRQFGWLPAETVEKIRAVDEAYLSRMRAARLRAAVGVQIEGFRVESPWWITNQWRRAVLRSLEYNEIAEFSRVNSEFAQRVSRRAEGIELSEDERRSLVEWEREFAMTHGHPSTWLGQSPSRRRWSDAAQANLHDRTRELLGDERGAVYLLSANPAFERMADAVAALELNATTLLDLWSLRRDHSAAINSSNSMLERRALMESSQQRVSALLGASTYQVYASLDEAKWLFPRGVVKAAVRAASNNR